MSSPERIPKAFAEKFAAITTLADNPMVWMRQVNGLKVAICHAPIELQWLAFEKGLIPYVPSEQKEKAE